MDDPEAKRDVQCDLESTKEESGRARVAGAEPPIDVPMQWRHCIIAASPTDNHSFSLSFSSACEKQSKSDLMSDYEHWGASFGEGNGILHLREWDCCQIILAEIKSTEKMFFPFALQATEVVLCVE